MARYRMRVQQNVDRQWEEIVEVEARNPAEAARKARDEVLGNLDGLAPVRSTYGEIVQVDEDDEDVGPTLLDW